MTITLPESLARRVEEQAASLGITPAAFVTEVLEQQVEFANLGGPESITPRSREELERMLLEGMQGEVRTIDSTFWQEIRERASQKLQALREKS